MSLVEIMALLWCFLLSAWVMQTRSMFADVWRRLEDLERRKPNDKQVFSDLDKLKGLIERLKKALNG